MAGSGFFGLGSSSTLSPLAPPFTVDRSAPKFNLNSQSTGPVGDLTHYSPTPIADNWLHIHPPSAVSDTDLAHIVENNYPISRSHDTQLPSLSPNHVFSYAREAVSPTSLPVAEAEPYYPKYPLPMGGSFEVGLPPSLGSFARSSEQAGPWSRISEGEKGEPCGSYVSSWKEVKGKVPNYHSPVMQGFSTSKENLGCWHGKAVQPFARKDNVGQNGISTEYQDGSFLHSALGENSGLFPSYNLSGSSGLQTARVAQETPCSHLSAPLVSLTEWSPFNHSITASHVTRYSHLDLPTVEPANSKSTISSSSQPLCLPAMNDYKLLEKGIPTLTMNMQTYDAILSSIQSSDSSCKMYCDVQKPRSETLNIKRKEVLEEQPGEKNMLFGCSDQSLNEYTKSETMHLNQSNIFTFSSGTGLSVRSSSEISDQLNHAVDSPCWKGAPSSRSPFAAAVQAPKEESVGLEVVGSPKLYGSMFNQENIDLETICSTPSRNPFSVICFTTKQKPIDGDEEAETSGSEKTEDGSKTFTNISVQRSGEIRDPENVHVLPDYVNSSSDLETACSTSISQKNVGIAGVTGCSEKSEQFKIANGSPLNLEAKSLVDTIYNLSKLLLSSWYFDLNTLKDQDYKNLRFVIDNLNACISAREMDDELGCTHDCKKPVDHFRQVDMRSNSEDGQRNLNDNPNQAYNSRPTRDGHCFSSNLSKLDEYSSEDIETARSTQAFKQSLRENVFGMDEEHPQTMVYKNLWIEAEAALCSMKFKLQCSQMHVEMEKGSHHLPKDSEGHAGMDRPVLVKAAPTCKPLDCSGRPNIIGERRKMKDITPDSSLERNLSFTDETSQTHMDPTASVMSRFRILQNRLEGSTSTCKMQAQNDPVSDNMVLDDAGIQSLFMKVPDVEIQGRPVKMTNLDFGEDSNPWPYITGRIKIVNQGVSQMGEPIYQMPTLGTNSLDALPLREPSNLNYRGTGEADYPASDWEHVLKEELAPKK